MMIMLRDDAVIEIFDSADKPPSWIEGIDIENGEYQFCDDKGQRFVGEITQSSTMFKQPHFRLRPEGTPDIHNAYRLLEQAKAIDPNPHFADLESLRKHLAVNSSEK